MKRLLMGLITGTTLMLTGVVNQSPVNAYKTSACTSSGVGSKWELNYADVLANPTGFPAGGEYWNALGRVLGIWNANPSNFYFNLSAAPDNNVELGNGRSEVWFAGDRSILNGAPAVTFSRWQVGSDRCLYTEADVVFDPNLAITTSRYKFASTGYGGGNRAFEPLAIHEFGHHLGLQHENRYYNVMGSDYTFVSTNGSDFVPYYGEDASSGTRYLYGDYSNPSQDVSVSHWKYEGTLSSQPEYSAHRRTQLYDASTDTVLSSYNLVTSPLQEPVYIVNRGQNINVEFTYENNGNANYDSIPTGFYLSTTDLVSTTSRLLGTSTYTLYPNTPYTGRNTVYIPNDVTPGIYYLGAILDINNSIAEWNEYDNASYIAVEVR